MFFAQIGYLGSIGEKIVPYIVYFLHIWKYHDFQDWLRYVIMFLRCVITFLRCMIMFLRCVITFLHCVIMFLHCVITFLHCMITFLRCMIMFIIIEQKMFCHIIMENKSEHLSMQDKVLWCHTIYELSEKKSTKYINRQPSFIILIQLSVYKENNKQIQND
jgi:hypothetical protein